MTTEEKLKELEQLGDDIYESLKEIQRAEGVKLENKALIADFLSRKLLKLGYSRPNS